MKILYVITSLHTGGAEKLMVDLLPRLRDLGQHVELLVFDGTRTPFYKMLENQGIIINNFKTCHNIYDPINILRLIPYIKKFDIIHTHNTACQYYVPLAKFLIRGKTRLFTTEHNTLNRRRNIHLFLFFDKIMYSSYEKIICISDKVKLLLGKYIGNERNLITINNGIDVSKYFSELKIPDPNKKIIVTMVAAFRKQKDQDTVIRAMALLNYNYTLRLVGDGERRIELEHLIRNLNLNERVNLLGIRNDIPNILQQSDVVVLSSYWEGFGLSAVEGMAAGKPVIASNVDGLSDIVNHYGLIFSKGNAEMLAEEIKHLIEDKEFYLSVATKCRRRAMKYDISKMVHEYNRLYI